jgi:small-conductance mechanosensitive channel
MDLLDGSFYGNTYHGILAALAIALAVLAVLELAQKLAIRHVSAMAEGRGGVYALVVELLRKTQFSVLVVLSLYAGTLNLSFPRKAEFLLNAAALITFLVQAAVWGNAAISFWLENYRTRKLKEDAMSVTMVAAMAFFVRVLLWALIVLIVLDYFGINITALVAGLGVGGIAVALAVQNILKDLFSSLSIVLDKPSSSGTSSPSTISRGPSKTSG